MKRGRKSGQMSAGSRVRESSFGMYEEECEFGRDGGRARGA